MGTTSEKLTYLNTTKSNIKNSIELMGTTILSEDTFRSYADKIKNQLKLYLKENSVETLWNNWNKVSGEGTSLTLNNTMEGKMKVDLKGNTQQNGEPTPDTPIDIQVVSGDNTIKVEGENLFDKDNANVIIGYINGSGVISSSSDNRTIWLPIKQNTDYAIKMTAVGISGSTSGDDVKIGLTKTQPTIGDQTNLIYSQSTAAGVNYTHEKTFNSGEYNYVVIKIGNTSRTNYGESIATLQICIGNVIPTTYTPYVSQSYPISLGNIELCKIGTYQDKIAKSSGKNLFDIAPINTSNYNTTYYIQSITTNSITMIGGSGNSSSFVRLQNFEANESYTLSYNFTFNYNRVLVRLRKLDDSGWLTNNDISWSGWSYNTTYGAWYKDFASSYNPIINITIPNALYWQLGLVNVSTDPHTYSNIMLLKGTYTSSNLPPYEPYTNKVPTWYLHKQIGKVVLNGSESWYSPYSPQASSTLENRTVVQQQLSQSLKPLTTNYLSNLFIYNSQTANRIVFLANNSTMFMSLADTITGIETSDSDTTKVNKIKTWLSTHNTTVYYVLATPTYTEITDTTLLSQLEALAYSYEGTTNISQVNNDLASELDVVALEDI